MRKKIYIEGMPLSHAFKAWNERLIKERHDVVLPPERVKTTEALHRVTAEAVFARVSSPFYHASAMDGYAIRFKDTFGAAETRPLRLRMGEQAIYVDTGKPVPDGFNAVVMIEDVNIDGEFIEIIEPATPWQHVRPAGEDIIATELILPESHRIRPADIGALLAGGHSDIMVRKKPRVALIPTGNELVEPGFPIGRGSIIEFNSRVLSALVTDWGGEPLRCGIVRDDVPELKKNIMNASDCSDLVVINAGSSAGSEDFTAQAIRELGDVIVHGISIKPGKPVILGIVNHKPVLGIPGYPVSAYITFSLFVRPLIYKWLGLKIPKPDKIRATLSRQIPSSMGYEEFIRVKVGVVGGRTIATPLGRGAGAIMSLVKADGIVRIPSASEGAGAGSEIEVELMRPVDEIIKTIVCIGSHDNTLDILSNFLRKRHPELYMSSAHVGSMGGLFALKKGEAHIAGIHLLDEATGQYNIPFIKRLLPGERVVLVNLAYRRQGLLVKKGNPKNIKGFEDLARKDIAFINRQSGSGTRLLLDRHIREIGMEPRSINGYANEDYTHMGIASAVLTGVADTGLAILAAAEALNLDFVPVAEERFDIAIPRRFMETDMIQALLNIMRNDKEFMDAIIRLGGYGIKDMGKVMFEN